MDYFQDSAIQISYVHWSDVYNGTLMIIYSTQFLFVCIYPILLSEYHH